MLNKNFFAKVSLALLTLSAASQAHAAVWPTTRNWTSADEDGFSDFIAKLPLDFFQNDRDFGGIPTDCADAAYTLRTIYAFRNGLPVSYSTYNGVVTNDTNQFDSIQDPIKRVRKFIARINVDTGTSTLSKDTYPISINRKSLRAGTMFLHPQGNTKVPLTYRAGHVYYIQDVPANGIVKLISSTVPAAVRSLNPHNGLVFAPMDVTGGYRNWRWPNGRLQGNESDQQFKIAKWYPGSYKDGVLWNNWTSKIEELILTKRATVKERLHAAWENLEHAVIQRGQAVNEGWAEYNLKTPFAKCMNDTDYDNYSTPTRDAKVQSELVAFRAYAQDYLGVPRANKKSPKLLSYFRTKKMDVGIGRLIDVSDLQNAFDTYHLQISEPEHSPEVRWGLTYLPVNQWPCPHRASAYSTKN